MFCEPTEARTREDSTLVEFGKIPKFNQKLKCCTNVKTDPKEPQEQPTERVSGVRVNFPSRTTPIKECHFQREKLTQVTASCLNLFLAMQAPLTKQISKTR